MKKPEVTFGVIADCQFASGTPDFVGKIWGSDQMFRECYSLSPKKFQEAFDTFKQNDDVEFVLHLGDYVDRNLDDARVLDDISNKSGIEVKHLIGNHDLWATGGDVQRTMKMLKMGSRYISEHIGGNDSHYRLIRLDSNELGPLEHKKGTIGHQIGVKAVENMRKEGLLQAYEWNGGFSERQLDWLDVELSHAEKLGEVAILSAHHQIFPPHVLDALNATEIIDVIDAHNNVGVFLNGHNHGGAFGTNNGVNYETLPGMLSGDDNAFGIVSGYDERLEIEGYGRVSDRIITIPDKAKF